MNTWARKHDCCINCKAINHEHEGNGLCVKCYAKEWQKNNEKHLKDYQKEWHNKNVDRLKIKYKERYRENLKNDPEYNKKYYLSHKKQIIKNNKLYCANNPEVRKAQKARRRSKKKNAQGSHDYKDRKLVFELANYKCLKCGSFNNLQIDHIVPIAKNGRNDIANLQVLCIGCNSSKGSRHATDYRSKDFKEAINCGV